MDKRTLVKNAGLGLLMCVLALPAAFILTVITFPVWRWFEEVSGIESFGHSGPAEWCYWLIYACLILFIALIWCKRQPDKGPGKLE